MFLFQLDHRGTTTPFITVQQKEKRQKIQSDINNSIDISISENNIKKTLISPSKSFKDIVEDITYIDIDKYRYIEP